MNTECNIYIISPGVLFELSHAFGCIVLSSLHSEFHFHFFLRYAFWWVCVLAAFLIAVTIYQTEILIGSNIYFDYGFRSVISSSWRLWKNREAHIMAAKRQRKTSWPSTSYNFQRHPDWHTSPTQTLPHSISMVSWSSATSWRSHTGNMNLFGTMTYLSLSIVLWPCHNHGHLRMQNMFI